jgi:hypothetical protein
MATPLDIRRARYVSPDGGAHYVLELTLAGGAVCHLDAEQKEGLVELGIVVLEGAPTPPLLVHPRAGAPLQVPGAVRDPRVFALWLQMLEDLERPAMPGGDLTIPPAPRRAL